MYTFGIRESGEQPKSKIEQMSLWKSILFILGGLVALVLGGQFVVTGATAIALVLGISENLIGLTIVAVGTSLPELASTIIAARKNEHDIALGNIIGSNLFNTLAVVGLAGIIHPLEFGPEVLSRDILVMAGLTVSLFILGYGFRGPGRINRIEGAALLASYAGYNALLLLSITGS